MRDRRVELYKEKEELSGRMCCLDCIQFISNTNKKQEANPENRTVYKLWNYPAELD